MHVQSVGTKKFIFLFKKIIIFVCMIDFPIYMYVYHMYIWRQWKADDGTEFSGVGVVDHCELLY